MKLTAGSIYKASSDKRAIFLAAFNRYTDMRGAQLHPLLEAETTGLGKLAATLRLYAETSQDIEGRRGCLVAGSAMDLEGVMHF
jgi:TetR/AcrR family transcriptional repressor of nem operon